jgi:hypothetical protein
MGSVQHAQEHLHGYPTAAEHEGGIDIPGGNGASNNIGAMNEQIVALIKEYRELKNIYILEQENKLSLNQMLCDTEVGSHPWYVDNHDMKADGFCDSKKEVSLDEWALGQKTVFLGDGIQSVEHFDHDQD